MTPAPRRIFILLMAAALLAGLWPAVLPGGTGSAAQDDCCAVSDDPCCEAPAPGSGSEDDDCCSSDCAGCFLVCCRGMVTLLTHQVTLDSTEGTALFTCRLHGEPSLVFEGDIDHPPRA